MVVLEHNLHKMLTRATKMTRMMTGCCGPESLIEVTMRSSPAVASLYLIMIAMAKHSFGESNLVYILLTIHLFKPFIGVSITVLGLGECVIICVAMKSALGYMTLNTLLLSLITILKRFRKLRILHRTVVLDPLLHVQLFGTTTRTKSTAVSH